MIIVLNVIKEHPDVELLGKDLEKSHRNGRSKFKMQGINLALVCGQWMEESCIKIEQVQNQNYYMDKW